MSNLFPDPIDCGDSTRTVHPLFQAEDDGLIPISPLQLEIAEIDVREAQRLNKMWHSVLPITSLFNISAARLAVSYAAIYKNRFYAVAIWTTPIAANRMIGGFDKAELRRLAIGPNAPKNTATRMMSIMRRLLVKKYPWVRGLVSYQAQEHHAGTIYKAAGWAVTGESNVMTWHEGEIRAEMQTKSHKIRWELDLTKNAYAAVIDRLPRMAGNGEPTYQKATDYQLKRDAAKRVIKDDSMLFDAPVKKLTPLIESILAIQSPPIAKTSALDFALAQRGPDAVSSASEMSLPTLALDFALHQVAPSTPPASIVLPSSATEEPLLASLDAPSDASSLQTALFARGHRLLTRDGKFFVSEASRLTPEDRAAIKIHRVELLKRAEPWIETPSVGSLAQFLGTAPLPDSNWQPQAPPALDGIDQLELDTETNGLRWWAGDRPIGISIRRPDGTTQYLPWGHAGGNFDEAVVKRWAERELRGKHLTGANIKFDVHMLREWGVDLEAQGCTVSDVQHYAALLDDNRRTSAGDPRPFSLDSLARSYLKKEKIGQDLDKTRMASYHAGQVASYAEHDVTLTGELRQAMWPLLDADNLQRVRQLEDDVIFAVCEMEKNAAPIDMAILHAWSVETERLQHEALWEVAQEVGFQVNPDSPGDWQRLFEYFHIPLEQFTGGGKPSFTDVILKQIDNRFVQLVRRAGKLASLRSKFFVAYEQVIGDDGLLRYSLHQLRGDEYGTVRGRFSASEKNIQQVMNHDTHVEAFGSEDFFVRRLFVPSSGLFLSADAQQIEYRIFVSHSGSQKLLEAYAEDPTISYHKKVWEMVKPYKADIPYTKVKSLNFLKLYGGGREKAAAFLELPRAESDQFVTAYDMAFPEVVLLLRKAESLAKSRGWVKTVLGRRARFPDKKFAHKALNAVIQGSAADVMKQKLVELHCERKETGFVLRYTVHDEVCGDAPDQECARKVGEILNRQSFPQLKVPILWLVNTGANWAECK